LVVEAGTLRAGVALRPRRTLRPLRPLRSSRRTREQRRGREQHECPTHGCSLEEKASVSPIASASNSNGENHALLSLIAIRGFRQSTDAGAPRAIGSSAASIPALTRAIAPESRKGAA